MTSPTNTGPTMANPTTASQLPAVGIRSADLSRDRTVIAFRGRQADGYYDPPHTHDRGQFSYRIEGFSVVNASGRHIFLPPGRGVWIPAGVVHEVTCRGPAAYNAFYVDRAASRQPETVRVIAVSPLLHALVECLLDEDSARHRDRHELVAALILDEIARADDVGATAPVMPLSPRLRALCDGIYAEPARSLDLDAWAAEAGMSRRTFTRTFRDETGLSPGKWHQQLRMHHVDGLLARGLTLQQAAFHLGYSGVASLARAYGRAFGTMPLPSGSIDGEAVAPWLHR